MFNEQRFQFRQMHIAPLVGYGILGGANLIGNFISGMFGASAQDKANETNLQMSRENREWQQYMSNTAYQRATTDMKQAGLNPIMSVSPASSPSGNAGQVEAVNPMSGLGSGISAGISSATDIASTVAEVDNKGSQTALNQASIATEGAKQAQAMASAKQANAQTATLQAELPGKAEKAELTKEQSKIDRNMLQYDNTMKRIDQAVGIGSSALDMAAPIKNLMNGRKQPGWSGKSKDLFEYMNRRP